MNNVAATKVLVVDGQHLARLGTKLYLASEMENVIFLEASNCQEAIALSAENSDIELVIVDESLVTSAGFGLMQAFRRNFSNVGFILFSECRDADQLISAYDLGVRGFVSKSCSGDTLLWAVRMVLGGGVYISENILNLLRLAPPAAAENKGVYESNEPCWSSSALKVLTLRQRDVLSLVAKGHSNKEICRELGLASGTVKNYVAAILRGLDVKNRTQAVSMSFNSEKASFDGLAY